MRARVRENFVLDWGRVGRVWVQVRIRVRVRAREGDDQTD